MTHFTPAEAARLRKFWFAANASKDTERRQRWATAIVAGRIVGLRDGQTSDLSKLLGITETAIQQLAGGWDVYQRIRKVDRVRAKDLRNIQSYHRFFSVGELARDYDLTDLQILEYLEEDLETTRLVLEIVNKHDPRPAWKRQAAKDLPRLWHYVNDFDRAPQAVRDAAENLCRALERYVG